MSATLSFIDLKLFDELSPYNSIQLLFPAMDVLVKSCLVKIGFDVTKAIEYVPCKHRSMQGIIGVDFVAVGEMSRDRKYRPMQDTLQRIVVAGYEDISLARHMESLLGKSLKYEPAEGSRPMSKKEKQYRIDNDFDSDEEEDSSEYIEDDYLETLEKIQQLTELRDYIRNTKQGEVK